VFSRCRVTWPLAIEHIGAVRGRIREVEIAVGVAQRPFGVLEIFGDEIDSRIGGDNAGNGGRRLSVDG
jgi:hypothetical protein